MAAPSENKKPEVTYIEPEDLVDKLLKKEELVIVDVRDDVMLLLASFICLLCSAYALPHLRV